VSEPFQECHDDHCITCGDVAESMRVLDVDSARALALCELDPGERQTVEIALVGPVEVGDWLLVHAGTAIARTEESIA
jgi:hydrogenase expression/formation protein HypC